MPATVLDPKTALIVIDLQKGISMMPGVHPYSEIVANTARLADAFRQVGLPVVLVNVTFSDDGGDLPLTRVDVRSMVPIPLPPGFADIAPELGPKPGDILITKRQPNTFYGTELDLQLRRRGVTGVVMTGISTSAGVDGTARAAQERGYNVTFARDAMTDRDPEVHELVVTKIFPRIGEVDTVEGILRLLPSR